MKSPASHLPFVTVPVPIIDPVRVRANIRRMVEKTAANGVSLRPHFKTHQSLAIGRWFRNAGVEKVAVSSVRMAEAFAADGWTDILVAFPANIRERKLMDDLHGLCHLQVLVDNRDTVTALAEDRDTDMGTWIKVDTGYGRTGTPWNQVNAIADLAREIETAHGLSLAGLLTHSGHSYHASTPAEIVRIFNETRDRMASVKDALAERGIAVPAVSIGDTPGCTLEDNFSGMDEIRPGNFVFYDLMQLDLQVCRPDDLALALACPVVGIYPDRGEAVILGGAVHFSKDRIRRNRRDIFGVGIRITPDGFGELLESVTLNGMSQEHGIVRMPGELLSRLQIGDVLSFIPAHSCLTADLYGHYRTPSGERIDRINSVTLRS